MAMRIDLNGLSEEELIDLNHKVVERLRLLRQARAHVTMMEFRRGERVRFQPANRPAVEGILTRFNRKSVTVITEQGEHWTVAPNFLERVEHDQANPNPNSKIHVVR